MCCHTSCCCRTCRCNCGYWHNCWKCTPVYQPSTITVPTVVITTPTIIIKTPNTFDRIGFLQNSVNLK